MTYVDQNLKVDESFFLEEYLVKSDLLTVFRIVVVRSLLSFVIGCYSPKLAWQFANTKLITEVILP